MLYKPIPIIAPNGSLSAIIGNLNNKKSAPAFIKIDGANLGLAHAIQNFDEIPSKIPTEIPLPSEFLTDTVWESAPKEIAICLFPVFTPVPFGAKIIKTHSFNKVYQEHGHHLPHSFLGKSVHPTQIGNPFQTIFNEVPGNKIDQLNPLHSHMWMTQFDKKS